LKPKNPKYLHNRGGRYGDCEPLQPTRFYKNSPQKLCKV
jgi:hypothetical protein